MWWIIASIIIIAIIIFLFAIKIKNRFEDIYIKIALFCTILLAIIGLVGFTIKEDLIPLINKQDYKTKTSIDERLDDNSDKSLDDIATATPTTSDNSFTETESKRNEYTPNPNNNSNDQDNNGELKKQELYKYKRVVDTKITTSSSSPGAKWELAFYDFSWSNWIDNGKNKIQKNENRKVKSTYYPEKFHVEYHYFHYCMPPPNWSIGMYPSQSGNKVAKHCTYISDFDLPQSVESKGTYVGETCSNCGFNNWYRGNDSHDQEYIIKIIDQEAYTLYRYKEKKKEYTWYLWKTDSDYITTKHNETQKLKLVDKKIVTY